MEKIIRNGKVAVLVSWEYGSGWYTVNHNEAMLFDPEIVAWVEAAKPEDRVAYFEKKYPKADFYGFRTLRIEWVPVGHRFIVQEYDGAEYLIVLEKAFWITA